MNIFYVDSDPRRAAFCLPDKLVVKMPLESAQLLSTAINVLGGTARYKTTHKNHPSAVWCRQSAQNYRWLAVHGLSLCAEYSYRYGKTHKCEEVIQECLSRIPTNFPEEGDTQIPQCMPDKYKSNDAVSAYRAYLVGEKQHYAKWTKRVRPVWFVPCLEDIRK